MRLLTLAKESSLIAYFLKPLAISLILAMSAQLNILMHPVPITMQPLALLFIGLLCTPETAVLSVIYYLVEIAIGLPFASGFSGGLAALLSPRAGYFVGFLASVYVSAALLHYRRTFLMMWVAACAATITLYACGLTWLSVMFGLQKAFIVGLVPFISEIPAFIILGVISSYQVHKIIDKQL